MQPLIKLNTQKHKEYCMSCPYNMDLDDYVLIWGSVQGTFGMQTSGMESVALNRT